MALSQREKSRRYYVRHQDELRAKCLAYRNAHIDERISYNRAYRASNLERLRETSRVRMARLRRANPEKARAYDRLRWRDNIANRRQKQGVWGQVYLARKRSLPATLSTDEWEAIKAAYRHRCAYCGERKKLTQDHVKPVSENGPYTRDNIVPACKSCNSSKGARPPARVPLVSIKS